MAPKIVRPLSIHEIFEPYIQLIADEKNEKKLTQEQLKKTYYHIVQALAHPENYSLPVLKELKALKAYFGYAWYIARKPAPDGSVKAAYYQKKIARLQDILSLSGNISRKSVDRLDKKSHRDVVVAVLKHLPVTSGVIAALEVPSPQVVQPPVKTVVDTTMTAAPRQGDNSSTLPNGAAAVMMKGQQSKHVEELRKGIEQWTRLNQDKLNEIGAKVECSEPDEHGLINVTLKMTDGNEAIVRVGFNPEDGMIELSCDLDKTLGELIAVKNQSFEYGQQAAPPTQNTIMIENKVKKIYEAFESSVFLATEIPQLEEIEQQINAMLKDVDEALPYLKVLTAQIALKRIELLSEQNNAQSLEIRRQVRDNAKNIIDFSDELLSMAHLDPHLKTTIQEMAKKARSYLS